MERIHQSNDWLDAYPRLQRRRSGPAANYAVPVPTPTHESGRDDLLILVIGKLRTLSVADLNEVNEYLDALTYPLRKQ